MTNSVEDNSPAPPDQPYNGREKRITFQLYDYWFGLAGDRSMPSLTSLKPDDIAAYRNNMVLIDLRDSDQEARLQVIGQALLEDLETDLTQAPISDVPRRTLLSRITDHYMEVLANKSPISFDAEFDSKTEGKIFYRGILLPFSDDGERINFILGGIRWINEAQKAENDQNNPNNQNNPPACEQKSPLDESAVDKNAIDESAGLEGKALESPSALRDSLKNCQKIIHGQDPTELRSRKSLYLALGAILDFYTLCCSNPQSYGELLQAEGLKGQKRAPFTPVLKLCFGRNYDKTRLTEYASALSYAHKNGQDGDSLPDYLNIFPGGIKGCVRAQRGKKPQPKPRDIRKSIDKLPVIAQGALEGDVTKDSGLCLILARKDGNHLDILEILPENDKNVNNVMKQIIKNSPSNIE